MSIRWMLATLTLLLGFWAAPGEAATVLRWGEIWCETEPYAGGKVARFYVAESASGTVVLPINPQLGRPEHHEFRWLELDVAAHLLPTRLQRILRWAQTVATAVD